MSYKEMLQDWGLGQYLQTFEDEGINDECFMFLDEETIRKIFLKSGHRLMFKHHYEMYLKNHNQHFNEYITQITETVSTASSASTETLSTASSTSTETIRSSGSESELPIIYSFEADNSYETLSDDSLQIIQSLNSIENTPQFLKPQSPKRNLLMVDETMKKKYKMSDSVFGGGLETTLKKYTDGQIALSNKYKLSNDCRQKVAKVIINELIASFGAEIRASTFLRVSEEIEQIFSNEKSSTYYIPYVPGGKNKKGYGPKGKLWSRYVNVKSALRNASNVALSMSSESNKNSPEKATATENTFLDFLKIATEPYPRVLEAWEQTYKIRRKLYLNADLESIFINFPCLKLNSGIELIETDFNKKFVSEIDIIYTTWPKVSEAVLKEVKERNINIGVSAFKDNSLHALMTLPYLFTPVTIRKTRKGGNWRPTRSEMQESFFLHISSYDELKERFSARKAKLSECGISLQPTGCVVGSLEDPDGYYIVIDDLTYKVESSVRALELLFKLFHALDLDYPSESEAIWLFIQEIVFRMKSVKKIPSTTAVSSDIKFHLQD